jgi:hypothetical protein
MARVPGYANASIHPDKIVKYLLVLLPKDDKSKFMFVHGFLRANIPRIDAALLNHVMMNEVLTSRPISDWNDPSGKTIAGHNYVVKCSFQTPDGTNPCIRTVWTVLNGQHPTFQTLLP